MNRGSAIPDEPNAGPETPDRRHLLELGRTFRSALDRHGYGFQYAVLKAVNQPRSNPFFCWIPWVQEFPVEVRGHSTRIDLVLRDLKKPRYLICECKRANPATANWCFARAPWVAPPTVREQSFGECIGLDAYGNLTSRLVVFLRTENIWQVALEVRTGRKGDERGSSRGEIEEAATQVLRGFNGLIELFRQQRQFMSSGQAVLIPVIFTTARLFTTEVELSEAALETGRISADELEPTERPWLWYDYAQTPGIKHLVQPAGVSDDLRNLLYFEYVRRIAIVGARGIDDFLRSPDWEA